MSERKVINKYYPPDFDPSKIPRGRKPKNNQVTVRMMMPMSVRCNTCGEYLYKGKKFNAKKETVVGEEYLGVKIFRFYMKCVNCSAEFTIKTDPKNSDYVAEMGCCRNFEPWRAKDEHIEEVKKKREEEETGDAMKALENRTMDSKVEMDIIEALDEIRSLNARNSRIELEELWEAQRRKYDKEGLSKEDLEDLNTVEFKTSSDIVKRVSDVSTEQVNKKAKPNSTSSDTSSTFIKILQTNSSATDSNKTKVQLLKPKIIPKIQPIKKTSEESKSTTTVVEPQKSKVQAGLGGLVSY